MVHEAVGTSKEEVMNVVKEMQEDNLKSHTKLNDIYKDIYKKSLEIERSYE